MIMEKAEVAHNHRTGRLRVQFVPSKAKAAAPGGFFCLVNAAGCE